MIYHKEKPQKMTAKGNDGPTRKVFGAILDDLLEAMILVIWQNANANLVSTIAEDSKTYFKFGSFGSF